MDQQYVPPVHLTRSSWGNRGHDGQQRYFVPGISPLVSSSHAVIMLTNSLCRRRRRDNEVEIIDVGTKWLVHYTVIIRRQCHPSSVGGAASGSSVCRISRQRPPSSLVLCKLRYRTSSTAPSMRHIRQSQLELVDRSHGQAECDPYQGESTRLLFLYFAVLSLMFSIRSSTSTAPPAGYGIIDRIRSESSERRRSPKAIPSGSTIARHEVECSEIDCIVKVEDRHPSTTTASEITIVDGLTTDHRRSLTTTPLRKRNTPV